MNSLIYKAVTEARMLSFWYKDSRRLAEPHTYGRRHNGGDGLCAWQIAGGSGEAFRLFLVDDMSQIECLDQHFPSPRPGYRPGDRQFSTIYAEL